MSVIVKGMEIPKHCIDCPMKNDEDDCVVQELQHWKDWDDMKAGCPLVDVDKLMTILKCISEAEEQIYGRCNWNFAGKCINEIENALTVLEVEVEE